MSDGQSANTRNDSDELQALFDSVAEQSAAPSPGVSSGAPAATSAVPPSDSGAVTSLGDSDELQALFDSVAEHTAPGASALEREAGTAAPDEAYKRVGQMARQLHDMLRGLGYDKLLEKTVEAIPDATDRLFYVANMTEQAACRVLNATDIAQPLQDSLEATAKALDARWDKLYASQLSVDEFKVLATDTRGFLKKQVPESVSATNAQLMEIMMAQDFQDLTGQVIKKVVTLAQEMETQMMSLLVDIIPDERQKAEATSLLNGPVVRADGRTDVVTNQGQVDDLLDSLGF